MGRSDRAFAVRGKADAEDGEKVPAFCCCWTRTHPPSCRGKKRPASGGGQRSSLLKSSPSRTADRRHLAGTDAGRDGDGPGAVRGGGGRGPGPGVLAHRGHEARPQRRRPQGPLLRRWVLGLASRTQRQRPGGAGPILPGPRWPVGSGGPSAAPGAPQPPPRAHPSGGRSTGGARRGGEGAPLTGAGVGRAARRGLVHLPPHGQGGGRVGPLDPLLAREGKSGPARKPPTREVIC